MGDAVAGKWVVGILIYFFLYLLVTTGVYAMKAWINTNDNRRITTNNPFITDSPFNARYTGCTGSSRVVNWQGVVPCTLLEGVDDYKNGCNNISGCTWHNVTDLFGFAIFPAVCAGEVNFTAYGLEENQIATSICANINNYNTCALFECNYGNTSAIPLQSVDPLNPISFLSSMWTVFKWSATLKLDLGLSQAGNIIVAFFGFYIPLLGLLIALYFMIPVIH